MGNAYWISAQDLAQRTFSDIPRELVSASHLIYSSPATLAFNSPGAQGFGVKRAGLAIPGSVMLLVSPGCCGRNTTMLGEMGGYGSRIFYQLMDETDIVTGRHLSKIPAAVQEVCTLCAEKPTVVMICITCVDALLGTDMERVCRRAEEAAGVPVLPCYMYALTREGRLPPMVAVRKTVYELLKPRKKHGDAMNILGFFSPLQADCELYTLFQQAGVRHIRELSRCESFSEYLRMAEANFNLVLNPESRLAAGEMERKLGIPSVELMRMYQLDKIQTQYRLLGQALGISMEDSPYYREAEDAVKALQAYAPDLAFSVGEISNADPFELSLALLRYGFRVQEIFGTLNDTNFRFVKKLAALSPETKLYSNLSPTMLFYDGADSGVTMTIGKDAAYYHPECAHVLWSEEEQPFGYAGVKKLFEELYQTKAGEGKA